MIENINIGWYITAVILILIVMYALKCLKPLVAEKLSDYVCDEENKPSNVSLSSTENDELKKTTDRIVANAKGRVLKSNVSRARDIHNNRTKSIQSFLNTQGWNLAVDGIMGKNTNSAIKEFGGMGVVLEGLNLYNEAVGNGNETDDNTYSDGYTNADSDTTATNTSNGADSVIPCWVEEGILLLGTMEVIGEGTNPLIDQFHNCSLGRGYTDNTSWCGSVNCYIFRKCGYTPPIKSAWALNWRNFGTKIAIPVFGCIATKKRYNREGKVVGGHVTMVVGSFQNGKYLYCMGGNQNDEYNIKLYKASDFVSFNIPLNYQATIALEDGIDSHPSLAGYRYTGASGKEN